MDITSVNFRVSWFRRRVFVWALLFFFSWSFLPSVSFAQQPTATMSVVSGTVLVNGQTQGTGTVLSAGDVIETQTGASVVLELSDGSLLELGEHTKVDLAELTQMATGARVSLVKLLWGRIRAKLSPGHQHAGSSFDIETPNAIVGVKFSEPDIEVSYSPDKVETIGLAHTVELIAKNLLTDEEVLVPVGSTVIIVGTTVKIVAGILAIAGASEAGTAATEAAGAGSTGTTASGTGTSGTASSGMGTGTKVALGVVAVAAAGGGATLAIIAANEEKDEPVSFTGTFREDNLFSSSSFIINIYSFVQNGTSVTGTYEIRDGFGDCTVNYTVPLTGTVNGEQLVWSWPFTEECCPCYHIGTCCARIEEGNYSATLFNNGNSLNVSGPPCTLQGYACVGVASNAVRQ